MANFYSWIFINSLKSWARDGFMMLPWQSCSFWQNIVTLKRMYFGEVGIAVGTNMKEFKTLTKHLSKECLTKLSLDLISCRVKGEGLIQGQCGGKWSLWHTAIWYLLNATLQSMRTVNEPGARRNRHSAALSHFDMTVFNYLISICVSLRFFLSIQSFLLECWK